MPRTSRLIVVANRLPFRKSGVRWLSSEGGLVTALVPIARQRHGAWIGWTGASERATTRAVHDGITIQPVALTERQVDGFYHEFSNRTLWPLYHDAIRTPEFDRLQEGHAQQAEQHHQQRGAEQRAAREVDQDVQHGQSSTMAR